MGRSTNNTRGLSEVSTNSLMHPLPLLSKRAWDDYLNSKMVKGPKNRVLPEHTLRRFSNFVEEKKIVQFEGMCTSTKLP